jgi:hypothetical protein
LIAKKQEKEKLVEGGDESEPAKKVVSPSACCV